MNGNKYTYVAAQVEKGVLHPDAHIFMQEDFFQGDIVMSQLSLKAALKLWGNDARLAAEANAKQLHCHKSFTPVHFKDLTPIQKEQILESHMFLDEKKCRTVKAMKVAGGNKQRDYIAKEDASSPTVATKSVLISCTTDAMKNREVAIIDIPNAFIQTIVENEKKKVVLSI